MVELTEMRKSQELLENLKGLLEKDFRESIELKRQEITIEERLAAQARLTEGLEVLERFNFVPPTDRELLKKYHATTKPAAVRVYRLLELFAADPDAPVPVLKEPPLVDVDTLRLVARSARIYRRFIDSRPMFLAALIEQVEI